MPQTTSEHPADNVCEQCRKPLPDGERKGSLTSFLFQASFCSCGRNSQKRGASAGSLSKSMTGEEFCKRCGLRQVEAEKNGSLTGFLFFHTRCKCPPELDKTTMMSELLRSRQSLSDPLFNTLSPNSKTRGREIDLAQGAVIGSTYKIIKLIGRGGMGEVYLAQHQTLGKRCALKVILPEQLNQEAWQRFQQEAKIIANLEHVNLAKVTDLGIHEKCLPYCAMEYVPGKNLAEIIAKEGPISIDKVLEIFLQVCDVVNYAHRNNLIHRDLKPANIMVVPNSENLQVKVLDFGLAKLTSQNRLKQSLTQAGDVFGSPFYMSPEQCNGEKVDRRSDIYSIGCTMFECLTGEPPFNGRLAAKIMFDHCDTAPPAIGSIAKAQKVPEGMEIIMAKLLRKNPVERYQSMGELKDDLLRVQAGKNVFPVYVDRGSAYKREPDNSTNLISSNDATTKTNTNTLRVSLIGCILAILAVVVLAAFVINTNFKTTPSSPPNIASEETKDLLMEPLNSVMPGSAQTPDAAAARLAANPTKVIWKENIPPGWISIECPKQFIGLLYWLSASGPAVVTDTNKAVANGAFKVPLASFYTLQIEPGTASWTTPGILHIFDGSFIQGLSINAQTSLVDFSDQRDAKLLTVCQSILESVAKWNRLELIELRCCNFDNAVAQKLQSIKSLQALCLVNCTIDVQALTKSPIFHRLKALYISSQESGDDILEGLSEDCALTKLDIWGTQISDRGLKNLSRCHNLKTVHLSGTPVTNDSITALASIKSLESLVIRQVRISPGVVGYLKALKHIPEVYIDLTNLNYSDRTALLKEMKNLKALDPRKEPLSQFAAE